MFRLVLICFIFLTVLFKNNVASQLVASTTITPMESDITSSVNYNDEKNIYDDEYNYDTFSDYIYGDGTDNDYYYYFDDQMLTNDLHICPSQCTCEFQDRSNSTANKTDKKSKKYEIKVDCSSQKLTTIRNLFDTSFPLNQIVNL